MIVQVYAGGVLAYDNRLPEEKGYSMQSILINEELNKGGSATLIIPPQHPLRDGFPAFSVPVEIYRDGVLRWRGRPLPHAGNFYRSRSIVCEGELCFLNDATLRPYTFTGTPQAVFAEYINFYNSIVEPWKQFVVGNVTVSADAEVTMTSAVGVKVHTEVNKLRQTCGGYIIFDSLPDGSRRINWYAEMPYTCNQPVKYGYNLMDYSSQSDTSGFATRIVPYGAADSDGKRITINVDGKDYVENPEAVALRGVIEAAVIYDDITDPVELQAAAERDVAAASTLPETIKLSAYDMSRQDLTLDAFRLGQRVNAESDPHELTGMYDLLAISEDLCDPSVGSVTLTREAAYVDSAGGTLTGAITSQKKDDSTAKKFASYLAAVGSLTATILGADGGCVRLLDTNGDDLPDTLYIADNPDPAQAMKVWRFNYEGWGASQNGYNGPFTMGATLKDGIVADFITAGTLDAALITVKNLVAEALKSVSGNSTLNINGAILELLTSGVRTFAVSNYADGQPVMYLYDLLDGTKKHTAELSPHHLKIGGTSAEPMAHIRVTGSDEMPYSMFSVDAINPRKTVLYTGTCVKGGSCTISKTNLYDLFAVYLGDGTTMEETPVLCYRNGATVRGIGGRAGTASFSQEMHLFEATVSDGTWTVEDASKHFVYIDGSISEQNRLQLMKVVGVI